MCRFSRNFDRTFVRVFFLLPPLCRVARKPQLRLTYDEKSRQETSVAHDTDAKLVLAFLARVHVPTVSLFVGLFFSTDIRRDERWSSSARVHNETLIA